MIADRARDLRQVLRQTRFDKTAAFLAQFPFFGEFRGYNECYKVLGGMVRMRCGKGCRAGGGPPFCKMRKCATKKGYAGCWECDTFETCSHLDFLVPSHGDAHIRNLRILKRKGVRGFLAGKKLWYSNVKKR